MKKTILFLAFIALISMSSCNGEKKAEAKKVVEPAKKEVKKEESTEKKEVKKEETAEKKVAVEGALIIEGDDRMMFNLKEMKVKAGTKVTVTLNHVGKAPKKAMGHNFVILKSGVNMAKFATKAMKAAKEDYIPDGGKDVIAHTKMLGGGESDTITFDAPAKGTYEFLCSFPGHFSLMKGKFIVE